MEKALLFLSIFLLLSCSEDKHKQAMNLFEQGKTWEESSMEDSAIIIYNKALKLLKQTNDKELKGCIYNRIGNLYLNNNLEPNAYEAFRLAFGYNCSLVDKTSVSYSLRGIGKSCLYKGNTKSALYYYMQAYKLMPQLTDSNEMMNIYNNLAVAYWDMQDYNKAELYNVKSLQLAKDSASIYRYYFIQADIFMARCQYDSAQAYLEKGIHSNNIYTKAGCYEQLAKLAKETENSNYVHYLEISKTLNDSIELLNQKAEIVSAEKKYIQNDIAQQNKFSKIWIIGIFITSVSFIYFIMHYHKKKIKKATGQLVANQAYIQKTNSQLDALLANIKQTGETCRKKFMRTKEYVAIKDSVKVSSPLPYKKQDEFYSIVLNFFDSYIKSLLNVITMSEEDCYLCCLFLMGLNTKQCANFRGITANGIRTQKTRIFQKIKKVFGADITFEYFFGLSKDR